MAITEGYTQLPADGAGKRIAELSGTKGGVTVYATQVVLADPDLTAYPSNYARVTDAAPADAALGLVVRMPGSGADNSTSSTMKVPVLAGTCAAAAPTFTDGKQVPLSLQTNGSVRVAVTDALPAGTAVIGHVIVDSAAGDVAHDAADSGNPVKVGAKAKTTNPTNVSDGDRVNLLADKAGRLVATDTHVRELISCTDVITLDSTTTETTLLAAAGANVYADLCEISIDNSSGTGSFVHVRDVTSGTIRRSFYLTAGASIQRVFKVPLKQTTANSAWTVTAGTSVSKLTISATFALNL